MVSLFIKIEWREVAIRDEIQLVYALSDYAKLMSKPAIMKYLLHANTIVSPLRLQMSNVYLSKSVWVEFSARNLYKQLDT